jgi:hypothetical protein
MKERLFLKVGVILFSSLFFVAEAQRFQLSSVVYIDAHHAIKSNIFTYIDSILVYQKDKLIIGNYYGKFTPSVNIVKCL